MFAVFLTLAILIVALIYLQNNSDDSGNGGGGHPKLAPVRVRVGRTPVQRRRSR